MAITDPALDDALSALQPNSEYSLLNEFGSDLRKLGRKVRRTVSR